MESDRENNTYERIDFETFDINIQIKGYCALL